MLTGNQCELNVDIEVVFNKKANFEVSPLPHFSIVM